MTATVTVFPVKQFLIFLSLMVCICSAEAGVIILANGDRVDGQRVRLDEEQLVSP